jgi:ProP effector
MANDEYPRDMITALAELFPKLFVAEQWQTHKPLKIGIRAELVDRGVLLPHERYALRVYAHRRMYQQALMRGGPRYDLDGQPCGEVTATEAEMARLQLEAMDNQALMAVAAPLASKGVDQ